MAIEWIEAVQDLEIDYFQDGQLPSSEGVMMDLRYKVKVFIIHISRPVIPTHSSIVILASSSLYDIFSPYCRYLFIQFIPSASFSLWKPIFCPLLILLKMLNATLPLRKLPRSHTSPPLTDSAGPSEMLLRLLVLDKELALLVEPMRLFLGDLDNTEDGTALAEDNIHLFEGTVGSFRVEEVDDREDERIAGDVLV
jgi:hypothetical protein